MKYFALLFFSSIANTHLLAQTPLSIPLKNHCAYSGTEWEEELYRFDGNAEVEGHIKEILTLGDAEQNFIIISTNVENIAAVVDNGQRYLFYSLDFIHKAKTIDIYGALAHEIGHHINKHALTDENRLREESEADFFMGYILSKKGFHNTKILSDTGGTNVIQDFLQRMKSATKLEWDKRLRNIEKGFERADRSLQLNSLQFENDPNLLDLTLPSFTFKQCYTTTDIAKDRFVGSLNLGKIDEKLQLTLDQRGFTNRSYFSVKNGFALVTQMEQYNKNDGTSRNDRTRWLDYPARDNFSSIMDYFTSILMPNKGFFRLFVFVVTDTPFKSSNDRVSKREATAWLNQGANRLPKALATLPYTEGYAVSVLVYEFEVPESNHVAKQICPTPKFDARTHLMKAGLGFN
jgi:hypothetical protein